MQAIQIKCHGPANDRGMSRPVTAADIPKLEHHCNSWVVTRKDGGEVIGEFYSLENLKKFDAAKVTIQTTAAYLAGLNP